MERPLHLALGVFDGVHLGHRAVIGAAVDGARASGGIAGVMTFEPHPIRILAPERAPRQILASIDHKERLLEELEVELLLVLRFTPELAKRDADGFARELLGAPPLRQVAVGSDWRFGRDRAGTEAHLRRLGEELGVGVTVVEPVMVDGERVSSTRIRQALRDGNLAGAAAMLGRPYTVMGQVVEGDQLGRRMGVPTANIEAGGEQLPPDGVYAVTARVEGEERPGVANLGVRPTVGGARRLLEVHLFDFDGNLYGQPVEVRFGRRLRGERKFAGVEELRSQIERDLVAGRALFANGEALEV